jgi:hypothetical protein
MLVDIAGPIFATSRVEANNLLQRRIAHCKEIIRIAEHLFLLLVA